MSTMQQATERFVRSVKPGHGWEAWQPFCHPDAGFRKLGTSSMGIEVDSLRVRGFDEGPAGAVPGPQGGVEVDTVYVVVFDGDRLPHLTIVVHDLVVDTQRGRAWGSSGQRR